MSNQSKRQESVRAVAGTTSSYEGDWHALFDLAGIDAGSFNGRMLAWINDYMGESFTELNGAMAAFAQDQGYSDWNSMGTFDAVGFSPADIPDLALWLDASDTATITQTGGAVSAWADKSGNGYNATQETGASQPTTGIDTLNGKNVLTMNGTHFFVTPSSLWSFALSNNTIFVVVKSSTPTMVNRVLGGNNGAAVQYGMVLGEFSGTLQRFYSGNAISLTTSSDGLPHLLTYQRDGTNGYFSRDSGAITSTNQSAQSLTSFNIGRCGTLSSGVNGIIAEIILYRRNISIDDRALVQNYLKNKWGTP